MTDAKTTGYQRLLQQQLRYLRFKARLIKRRLNRPPPPKKVIYAAIGIIIAMFGGIYAQLA